MAVNDTLVVALYPRPRSKRAGLGKTPIAEDVLMKNFISRFVREESGVTAVEYALIVALVSIALVGGARLLGSQVSTTFNTAKTTMKTA
jgi:pilus assembly protein Flp/PilA